MKRPLPLTALALAAATAASAQTATPPQPLTLHYDRPAQFFEESLPIGNGSLGALIYGGLDEERISLNDITLWTGEPDTALYAPEAHTHIARIRELLDAHDYAAAHREMQHVQGQYSQNYQPLGTLTLSALPGSGGLLPHRHEPDPAADQGEPLPYRRELDLTTATVSVSCGGQVRECFASAPDSVIVVRWTAAPGAPRIARRIAFHSLQPHGTEAYVMQEEGARPRALRRVVAQAVPAEGRQAELVADGYTAYRSLPNYVDRDGAQVWHDPGRGIHFRTAVRIVAEGAEARVSCPLADEVVVEGAEALTLYITNVTSFAGADRDPVREGREYRHAALARLDTAAARGYEAVRERQREDHAALFGRMALWLGATPDSIAALPTDVQLRRYTDLGEPNPALEALYAQYGRYLLISSSRTPEVPAGLQGLWNEDILPPWSGNYTLNINLEENYWPALTGNLAEMHRPLLGFVGRLPQSGRRTARAYYGAERGWNAGQNSDLWAMTNPVGLGSGDPSWANWMMGGAWLATHLWEHYAFTMDRTALAEAYPALRGAADFCLAWLVERDGHLMTSPGTSPENKYRTPEGYVGSVLAGATADVAIIRECLNDTRRAAEVLGIDGPYRDTLGQALERLLPYRIGRRGNLQEWLDDWDDEDPQHRHQSHLFGLFPGHQISRRRTPELAAACARTLEIKGENTTGWSTGWRVNLYARLGDGEGAYRLYRKLLTYVSPEDYRGPGRVHRGGTYPNLLDAHPPFQIDGNFGGTAGVIEMLVQSELTEGGEAKTTLLPALPEAWRAGGELRGVRLRGGYELGVAWRDGRLTLLTVRSLRPDRGRLTLRCAERTWRVALAPGQQRTIINKVIE